MKKTMTGLLLLPIAAMLLTGCTSGVTSNGNEGASAATATTMTADSGSSAAAGTSQEAATQAADVTEAVVADIDIADYGRITVALDPAAAPLTVENFVSLAKSGFYDGLTFHRIMEGFMMQGGDPTGTGSGGSENNIRGEFASNGVDNPLSHTRGAISMARATPPDSASSQFFIVHEDSTFLDGDYAAFGYVTEGMDVVDRICQDAEPVDNNGTILPENQPVMTAVTIR
ncbi:MAG: peptidylprolyl isomerase [Lachnospiraceae bacterium]|nr:peptidylprolyl isomerase [Lachnospiraceae bacterium]